MTLKGRAKEIFKALFKKEPGSDGADFSYQRKDLTEAEISQQIAEELGLTSKIGEKEIPVGTRTTNSAREADDSRGRKTTADGKSAKPTRIRSTLNLNQVLSDATSPRNTHDGALDLADALHAAAKAILAGSEFKNVRLTEPNVLSEPNFQLPHASRSTAKLSYYRWRASTKKNSLSVRARDGYVEIFSVPTDDVALRSFSEFGARLKARFELAPTESNKLIWYIGRKRLDFSTASNLLAELLGELVGTNTKQNTSTARTDRSGSPSELSADEVEQQNMLFRMLNDQEVLKNELARTLHDTVLADLLMLKRHMRGDQEMQKDEIIEAIDEIAQQLRDLCNECAPRNLHDWGMKTSLQDLLQRMEQRTGISCKLNCDVDIPNMPATVELHIFRLMQESLNNIEKHAGARKIVITVEQVKAKTFRFTVTDDGKGFAPANLDKGDAGEPAEKNADSGGMGLSGMTERVQLIRSYFPAQFGIDSSPGQGTTLWVEVTVATQA